MNCHYWPRKPTGSQYKVTCNDDDDDDHDDDNDDDNDHDNDHDGDYECACTSSIQGILGLLSYLIIQNAC